MSWHAKPSGGYTYNSDEGRENIIEARDILVNEYNYTLEAVTGVLANSYYEGGLNPWRWGADRYPPPSYLNGCGLFGFTPYTEYLKTTNEMNLSVTTITPNASPQVGAQQIRLVADNKSYWTWQTSCWRTYWSPSDYPQQYALRTLVLNTWGNGSRLTIEQFATIDDIPSAVFTFLACFEGPSIPNYDDRLSVANAIYEIISGEPPHPPIPPTKRKGLPIYMMIRRL